MVHAWLAAYYASGWRSGEDSGEREIDMPTQIMLDHLNAREHELEDPTQKGKMEAEAVRICQSYHVWYTNENDYGSYRVAADTQGEPLIEREYELVLSPGRIFTTRPDVVMIHDDYFWGFEHKTQAASRLWALLRQLQISGQVSGQILALRSAHEQAVGVIGNVLVKDRGKSSDKPPFKREHYQRTDDELAKFRLDVIHILDEIDDHVGRWQSLVAAGMDDNEAANRVFNATVDHNICVGFRTCEYFGPCKARGYEGPMFDAQYRARFDAKGEEESE
jgi:hypothetical protein